MRPVGLEPVESQGVVLEARRLGAQGGGRGSGALGPQAAGVQAKHGACAGPQLSLLGQPGRQALGVLETSRPGWARGGVLPGAGALELSL